MKGGVAWLTYRKLRPALGIPFAFVLMSGFFLGTLGSGTLIAAAGLMLVDLFGNFYNDYADFADDSRSGRKDKFTTSGSISRKSSLRISILFLAGGMCVLAFSGAVMLALGGLLAFLLFAYSHPALRLKGKVSGYAAVSLPYFLLPLAMAQSGGLHLLVALPLSAFFYMQCIYILCQKDSTDTWEKDSIFVKNGWERSYAATFYAAVLSSASMLFISLLNFFFVFPLLLGAVAKAANLRAIKGRNVNRKSRGNFVLMEFISHYTYAGGVFFA